MGTPIPDPSLGRRFSQFIVRHSSAPFAIAGGVTIRWGQFVAEARALANRLPQCPQVINLCENRYNFCLSLVASLLRGSTTLLPPDRGARHLKVLELDYPNALILTDQPEAAYPAALHVVRPVVPPVAGHVHLDLPDEQEALMAFTSGSTGAPRGYPKTWGSLCESARLIDDRLGGSLGKTLVATVPAQHMYGLELSILLPLCRGAILYAGKPFFPADIAESLGRVPSPRVLVTTPIHLRALLQSELPLPPVAMLVSATAQLEPALARACEARFQAPLLEIYGCTEAGSIAGRQPALDEPWTLYESVILRSGGSNIRVEAPHLREPVELHDALESLDERRFSLIGRKTDLVNIAGKRASLAALDGVLLALDGVRDGAFFLPEDNTGVTPRLVVFVVAPGLTSHDILRHLRAELDPAFLPRAIHLVDRLPRNDRAKLSRQKLEDLLRHHQSNPVTNATG